MHTPDVLERAAEVIEARGWVGPLSGRDDDPWGGGMSTDKPVCVEGALMAALGMGYDRKASFQERDYQAFRATDAYQALVAYIEPPHGKLWRWNDQGGVTKESVIRTLRAAANELRTQLEDK